MPKVEEDQSAPKNARYMWYVEAYKGHTTVDLPCWEGESEARNCADILAGRGWIGPVTKKDKATGEVTRAEKPRIHQETVPKSHPHWREYLPSVDLVERSEQLRGKK